MKSTIRVDYLSSNPSKEMEPVIRVNYKPTDDVRDKLISTFFQKLGGESSWLSVEIFNYTAEEGTDFIITPIPPSELENAIGVINGRLGHKQVKEKVQKPKPSFQSFLLGKLTHLEQYYKGWDEFKEHILSGEVTLPITDLLKFQKEYENL